MKKCLVLIITLLYVLQASASHISGGELFYEYLGPGSTPNSSKYKITLRLFSDCHPLDPAHSQKIEDEIVVIGIYNSADLSLQSTLRLPLQLPITNIASNPSAIPCLTSAPDVCFKVGVFTTTTELPITAGGYTLTWVRCCRPNNIGNLGISSGAGGTYTTTIPGTLLLPAGNNSSPQFATKDTALVCQNRTFTLDFGATDPDQDSISYTFCEAYSGGTELDPDPGAPGGGGIPPTLSLEPLPYKTPYSGSSPLGPSVSINPASGKITGRAPATGRYVINVCATERRNGKTINVHRKDFILEVGNCDFAAAEPLPITGVWCKDFNVQFSNSNPSTAIQSYHWDFGVPNASSDEATPVYTYADTGTYTVKLTVHGAGGCVDEATTTIGVYPGLKPDFDVVGSCFKTPFNFKDQSTTKYGTINSWNWDFGNNSDALDISPLQNPTYTYSDTGTRNVKLIVSNSKGCTDSITKPIEVKSVAALSLPFKDTLICSIDTLPLKAIGIGTFTWTPSYNIINSGAPDPLVYPKKTTTYYVSVADEDGCTNSDSLKINVLDSIQVDAGPDTSICLSDSLTLNAISSGLQYTWTPASGLTNANIKDPVARPDTSTTYTVTANLGNCRATDAVKVKVAPFPRATAGRDTLICYGETAQLSANITGASFTWSPSNSLSNSNTLAPVAHPSSATAYILTVYDTLGCPKPGIDTVVVNVIPPIHAFAGNDTAVIAGQPLQLNAVGGDTYSWSPATGMDNPSIPNPIINLNASYDSIIYKVRVGAQGGCFAEDEIKVKVFKTGPDIFIPSAFTPNSDGRNDILKPIPVGIRSFDYFRVYNRWGQMLFSTSSIGNGWDGTFQGREQATGTYVFMARGIDYLGRIVSKKGTVVLIR